MSSKKGQASGYSGYTRQNTQEFQATETEDLLELLAGIGDVDFTSHPDPDQFSNALEDLIDMDADDDYEVPLDKGDNLGGGPARRQPGEQGSGDTLSNGGSGEQGIEVVVQRPGDVIEKTCSSGVAQMEAQSVDQAVSSSTGGFESADMEQGFTSFAGGVSAPQGGPEMMIEMETQGGPSQSDDAGGEGIGQVVTQEPVVTGDASYGQPLMADPCTSSQSAVVQPDVQVEGEGQPVASFVPVTESSEVVYQSQQYGVESTSQFEQGSEIMYAGGEPDSVESSSHFAPAEEISSAPLAEREEGYIETTAYSTPADQSSGYPSTVEESMVQQSGREGSSEVDTVTTTVESGDSAVYSTETVDATAGQPLYYGDSVYTTAEATEHGEAMDQSGIAQDEGRVETFQETAPVGDQHGTPMMAGSGEMIRDMSSIDQSQLAAAQVLSTLPQHSADMNAQTTTDRSFAGAFAQYVQSSVQYSEEEAMETSYDQTSQPEVEMAPTTSADQFIDNATGSQAEAEPAPEQYVEAPHSDSGSYGNSEELQGSADAGEVEDTVSQVVTEVEQEVTSSGVDSPAGQVETEGTVYSEATPEVVGADHVPGEEYDDQAESYQPSHSFQYTQEGDQTTDYQVVHSKEQAQGDSSQGVLSTQYVQAEGYQEQVQYQPLQSAEDVQAEVQAEDYQTVHQEHPQVVDYQIPEAAEQGEQYSVEQQGEQYSVEQQGEQYSVEQQEEQYNVQQEGEQYHVQQGEQYSVQQQEEQYSVEQHEEQYGVQQHEGQYGVDQSGDLPQPHVQSEYPSVQPDETVPTETYQIGQPGEAPAEGYAVAEPGEQVQPEEYQEVQSSEQVMSEYQVVQPDGQIETQAYQEFQVGEQAGTSEVEYQSVQPEHVQEESVETYQPMEYVSAGDMAGQNQDDVEQFFVNTGQPGVEFSHSIGEGEVPSQLEQQVVTSEGFQVVGQEVPAAEDSAEVQQVETSEEVVAAESSMEVDPSGHADMLAAASEIAGVTASETGTEGMPSQETEAGSDSENEEFVPVAIETRRVAALESEKETEGVASGMEHLAVGDTTDMPEQAEPRQEVETPAQGETGQSQITLITSQGQTIRTIPASVLSQLQQAAGGQRVISSSSVAALLQRHLAQQQTGPAVIQAKQTSLLHPQQGASLLQQGQTTSLLQQGQTVSLLQQQGQTASSLLQGQTASSLLQQQTASSLVQGQTTTALLQGQTASSLLQQPQSASSLLQAASLLKQQSQQAASQPQQAASTTQQQQTPQQPVVEPPVTRILQDIEPTGTGPQVVNLYVQWQNVDALCWLDVLLCPLVHSPTLTALMTPQRLQELEGTILCTLLKAYRQSQSMLQALLTRAAQQEAQARAENPAQQSSTTPAINIVNKVS